MRFEVRNSGGVLYGTVSVQPRDLARGNVRFARAKQTRMFGTGFLSGLDEQHQDLSYVALDMKVSQWATPPVVHKDGAYEPGRIDLCLIWDGPQVALGSVRTFIPAEL